MQQIQDTDLKTLRIFIAIVKCGGFAAAQPALGLSTSSISEYMSNLETRLGVRLCDRGRAGFRLTEEGKIVFNAAQRLLSSIEEFRLDVSSLTESLRGELRLGLIDNIFTNPLSPLTKAIQRFSRRSEQLKIQIEIGSPYKLEQDVLEGRLHLAVAPSAQRIRGLNYLRLMFEEQGLYCGLGHSLFDAIKVSLHDIQQCRIISRGYLHGKDLKLIKTQIAAAVADNVEARLLLLLTGEYIGFLPRHFAARWAKAGQLRQLLPDEIKHKVPFYLIKRSGDSLSRPLSVFIQDMFDSLPGTDKSAH